LNSYEDYNISQAISQAGFDLEHTQPPAAAREWGEIEPFEAMQTPPPFSVYCLTLVIARFVTALAENTQTTPLNGGIACTGHIGNGIPKAIYA
jgi:hypothetical protein